MKIPGGARSLLSAAADTDLPFALWRRPDTAHWEALVSCNGLTKRPVFAKSHERPFFAINRVDVEDANLADAIEGDVRLDKDGVKFWTGSAYGDDPVSDDQKRLLELADDRMDVPVQSRSKVEGPLATDRHTYELLVERCVQQIKSGRMRKLVTSRVENRALPPEYDLLDMAERLAAKLPSAFVALVHLPETGSWLVGTPEILLSSTPDGVDTMALAGTQWVGPDPDLRNIGWPDGLIEEQALVSNYIRRAFLEQGIDDFEEVGPRTVSAANLVHLRTIFRRKADGLDEDRLAGLLRSLHPTSAVCGMPKPPAIEFLKRFEGYDRGYYTGYLGPVDWDGSTKLYVNLRTAQILGQEISLYVGGGIVETSNPAREWIETVEKTKTVGSII